MIPLHAQNWFGAFRARKLARVSRNRRLEIELLEDRLVPAIAGTLNQNFLAQAYLDQLGRQIDPSGLASWGQMLDQGVSRTQVVLSIQNSFEYREHELQAAYHAILGRDVDTVGMTFGVIFLIHGGLIEQVDNVIYASPEFFQKNGGTNDGFLSGIYVDLLGRPTVNASGQPIDPVDPNGRGDRAAWDSVLASGVSRLQVATLISQGIENLQHQVNLDYLKILRRDADATGLALFSTFLPVIGVDYLSAILTGSDEYLQNVQKNPPTVPGINTTQLLLTAAPAGTASVGTALTFTATVSPASDGRYSIGGESVSFTDGASNSLGKGTLDANGVAKLTTSALGAGSHTITARFAGDSNFTASSGTTTVLVGQAASTVSLSSQNTVTRQSDGVSLTILLSVVPGPLTPGGSVQIEEQVTNGSQTTLNPVGNPVPVTGTPAIQNGLAVYTLTARITTLPIGDHVLVAVYSGDANFTGNTSNSVTQTVVPDTAQSPTVTITSSTGSSSVTQMDVSANLGQGVTFTATASPPVGVPFPLMGILTLRNGITVLGTVNFSQTPGGQITSQSLILPAGITTITAIYVPSSQELRNGIYAGAQASLRQQINPQPVQISSIAANIPTPLLGETVTVTARIDATDIGPFKPTDVGTNGNGRMHFVFGNQAVDVPLTFVTDHYEASFSTGTLGAGSYRVTASYNGNDNYTASSPMSVSFAVAKEDTTVAAQLANGVAVDVPFTTTVSAVNALPATAPPTGTVTISAGGISTTVSLGQLATLAGLGDGNNHTVTVQYNGDANYNSSTHIYTLLYQETTTSDNTPDNGPEAPFDEATDHYILQ